MNNFNIGILNEKDVHSFLKNHYQPNKNYQEIKINNFIADIFYDNTVIEIQTSNFSNLIKKLEYYLPLYKVIVVYPIIKLKYISWIDTDNGEATPLRKSPKNSNITDSAFELNKISKFLNHKNLEIHLVFLEGIEYKLLNGFGKNKKIKANKYNTIPKKILKVQILKNIDDYHSFLPNKLNYPFTVKQLSKIIKRNDKRTRQIVYLLENLNIIKKCGKDGRSYLYTKSKL